MKDNISPTGEYCIIWLTVIAAICFQLSNCYAVYYYQYILLCIALELPFRTVTESPKCCTESALKNASWIDAYVDYEEFYLR